MQENGELTVNIVLPKVALELRELRLTKGLSLIAVAKACKIHLSDLSAWEMGQTEPPKEALEKLFSFYS